jgi:hypothetical protein
MADLSSRAEIRGLPSLATAQAFTFRLLLPSRYPAPGSICQPARIPKVSRLAILALSQPGVLPWIVFEGPVTRLEKDRKKTGPRLQKTGLMWTALRVLTG